MKKIKNYDVLTSHGDVESRKIVLDITDKTLQRLDAYNRIKSIMRLEGDILHIGTKTWDLSKSMSICLEREKPAITWQWPWMRCLGTSLQRGLRS